MHEELLHQLFAPLGVYRKQGGFHGAEVGAVGAALDGVLSGIETMDTESSPVTAQTKGFAKWCSLFARGVVPGSILERRNALQALLKISGDGFTGAALEEALYAAGTQATVTEIGDQAVRVEFPRIAGIPENFDRIRAVIEDVLPCHLEVDYQFWYMTWVQFETRFSAFARLEDSGLSWDKLERQVGIVVS